MIYAKLINSKPQYWNGHTTINGKDIFTNNPTTLGDGWKIVDETIPEHREGYNVVYDGWEEDDTYIYHTYHYEEIHIEPTPDIEQIEAQGLYTATMTDTLLEDAENE